MSKKEKIIIVVIVLFLVLPLPLILITSIGIFVFNNAQEMVVDTDNTERYNSIENKKINSQNELYLINTTGGT